MKESFGRYTIESIETLAVTARSVGMKTPSDENLHAFSCEEFPHFAFFLDRQLGRAMSEPLSHIDNCKIISKIPVADLEYIGWGTLLQLGFDIVT